MSVTCTVTGEIFVGWFNPSGSKITTSSSANIRVESSGSVHTLKFVDIKVSYGSNNYECRGSRTRKSLLLHVACKYKVNVCSVPFCESMFRFLSTYTICSEKQTV